MPTEEANPQADLVHEAEAFAARANANHSGDKYIASSAPRMIESNGRVEKALIALTDITAKNIDSTEKYNHRLLKLTQALVWLTVVLVIGLGVQLYLAFAPHNLP